MSIHILKTLPPYYEEVKEGNKLFELRKNDRDFKVDDLVFLCEYRSDSQEFTGGIFEARITYVLEPDNTIRGLMPGYVIFGFSPIDWGYVQELDGVTLIDVLALKNSRGFRGMIL